MDAARIKRARAYRKQLILRMAGNIAAGMAGTIGDDGLLIPEEIVAERAINITRCIFAQVEMQVAWETVERPAD